MNKFILVLLLTLGTAHGNSAIPAKELFKNPDVLTLLLSPDATRVLEILNDAEKYTVRIINIDTNLAKDIVFNKDTGVKLKDANWVDRNSIHITYDLESSNITQSIIDVSLNDTQLLEFTHNAIQAQGEIIDMLPNESDTVLFAKTLYGKDEAYRLYKVNTKHLISGRLPKEDEYLPQLDDAQGFVSTGSTILGLVIDDDETIFKYYDENSSDWENFLVLAKRDFTLEVVGSLENGKLAVLSNYQSDRESLFEFDPKSQTIGKKLYQHSKYDLTGAFIDSDTGTVSFVTYIDHGQLVRHYLNSSNSVVYDQLKLAFKDKQISILSSVKDKAIVSVSASDEPGTYYLFDQNSNAAELLDQKFGNLEKYELTRTIVSTVKAEDGTEIETLFTPAKNSNGVLLVKPHGGPIGVRDYDRFNAENQYLASRGFSILQVNFRGSEGFGTQFQKAGVGQFGLIIESDITAAVSSIKETYHFDKMCSIGSSYGGYSSMMLSIKYPEQYDCVVATFGIYDLPYIFSASNLMSKDENKQAIINTIGEMRESLYSSSPFYLAEQLKAPTLMISGKKDPIAHFEHSNRMKYRLNQLDADLETVEYKNSGHGHSNWLLDRHQAAVTYDFLKRKLKLTKQDKYENIASSHDETLTRALVLNSEHHVQQNKEKAFELFMELANQDVSRAQYFVGRAYETGEGVELDLDKAASWYRRSAKNQYLSSVLALAMLNSNKDYANHNYVEAVKNYQQATELGYDKSYLYLAKLECLGLGMERNVEQCAKTFNFQGDKKNNVGYKDERTLRSQLVNQVFVDGDFSKVEREHLYQVLTESIGVDDIYPSLNARESGLFYRNSDQVKDKTGIIPIKKGAEFGSIVKMKPSSSEVNKYGIGVVLVEWLIPESAKSKEKGIDDQIFVTRLRLNVPLRFSYSLDDEVELVAGEWKLRLSNLEGEVLYEKTFYTQ